MPISLNLACYDVQHLLQAISQDLPDLAINCNIINDRILQPVLNDEMDEGEIEVLKAFSWEVKDYGGMTLQGILRELPQV